MQQRGFPFGTALATLAGLFLFFGIVHLVHHAPNYLGETKSEPRSALIEKLDSVRSRSKSILDGNDPTVRMSSDQSTAVMLEHTAKSKDEKALHGRLPFPVEPKTP